MSGLLVVLGSLLTLVVGAFLIRLVIWGGPWLVVMHFKSSGKAVRWLPCMTESAAKAKAARYNREDEHLFYTVERRNWW